MSAEAKNIYAPLPDTERGKPFVLHADPKGENFLYAHGKNIICRNVAVRGRCDRRGCRVRRARTWPLPAGQ